MKGHQIIILTFLLLLLPVLIQADVLLTINPQTLCVGSRNNVIPLIQDNPDEAITSLQVDIYFDTDYFTVTVVVESPRAEAMDLFNYSSIIGGIRIAMANCFHSSYPGTGPIAYIFVDVSSDCPPGEYLWELKDAIAQTPQGSYPILSTIDGTITVTDCEPCSLRLSTTELDFENVAVGQGKSIYINLINKGPSSGYVFIDDHILISADPSEFIIDPESAQTLKITCFSNWTDNIDEGLKIYGCRDPLTLQVKCNFVPIKVIFSIENQCIFESSDQNKMTLQLEHNVNVNELQTDILYDTTSFDIISIKQTKRSEILRRFNVTKIDGGIRIYMYGSHVIEKGSGPIAEIVFNVNNTYEEQYIWDVTNTIATSPLRLEITPEEVDGIITVVDGQRGDVDNNGIFNVLDVFWALRLVLGDLIDPTPRVIEAADCNDDGVVDVTDVIGIVNVVLGLGTCPP